MPTYYTRRQLPEFLWEHGYLTSLSTLNRICSPAEASGPPVSHYAGQRAIYEGETVLAWARRFFAARRGRYAGKELVAEAMLAEAAPAARAKALAKTKHRPRSDRRRRAA